MRPLLCLVMIVKDEAATIRDVLDAAKSFVDQYAILDTGSTDGTQEIVRDALRGASGTLFEEPFVGCSFKDAPHLNSIIDYAATRNRALDLAASCGAVFSLMLSGDEYLRGGDKLREHLERHRDSNVDCFHVRLLASGDALYPQRVLRAVSAWRYEKAVHEVPFNRVDSGAQTEVIPGVTVEHDPSDEERRYENIFERHIPVLHAMLDEDPNDEHALRYLAQSWETLIPFCDQGERVTRSLEVMSYYLRLFQRPDYSDAQRNYLKYKYLHAARFASVYSEAEVLSRVQEICEADPQRPEPALLRVYAAVAARVPTAQVYGLASEAAKVAAAWAVSGNCSPVPTSCEWKAHHAAAQAARRLGERAAEVAVEQSTGDEVVVRYAQLLRDHVSAGLAAGGPWEVFKSLAAPRSRTTVAEKFDQSDAT